MTNFEKLRGMDEKELGQYLCDLFPTCHGCPCEKLNRCFRDLLNEEAEDDDDDDSETQ